MKFLHLIWCNLKRRKLRTSLTVLSIFVAFLLYGLLSIIQEAFMAGVTMAGADRLIVRHKVSLIMNLPESYTARMERIPGVAAVAHFTWFNGIYQDDPKNFFGSFPISDLRTFLTIYPEIYVPPEQLEAYYKTRNGVVIGRALVDRFQWKIGDRIPLKSPIWRRANDEAWEFEVVGIYEAAKKNADTSGFYFRYDYFDEGRSWGEGLVGWFGVKVHDPDQADAVAKAIDAEFANSPYETKAEPEGAFVQGFMQQIGDIGTIMIAILSAVFFTILLIAGNTMAQTVRERTEELGVLKAMGYTNELVLVLVLAESCVLAMLGGVAGLGLAWIITLGGSPVPTMLPIFYLPARAAALGAGLVVGLGVLAGIIPALQAMRLQIAVALRRQA